MKRFMLLVLIGVITFAVLFFANNPDVPDDLWLYLVGLSGVIIKTFRMAFQKLNTFLKGPEREAGGGPSLPEVIISPNKKNTVES